MIAAMERASARPFHAHRSHQQAMSGTLMATATIAQATGVRVSCMA